MAKKRAEGESRARANTRSRLVDAAIEILVERGFAGTKIDEVVASIRIIRIWMSCWKMHLLHTQRGY